MKRGAVLPPVAASPACRLQLPRRSLALDADRGQRHPRPDLFHRGGLAGLNPCGDRPRHPLGQRHEVVSEPEPLLRLEHRQEALGHAPQDIDPLDFVVPGRQIPVEPRDPNAGRTFAH